MRGDGFRGLRSYLHDPESYMQHAREMGSASMRPLIAPGEDPFVRSTPQLPKKRRFDFGTLIGLPLLCLFFVGIVKSCTQGPESKSAPASDYYPSEVSAISMPAESVPAESPTPTERTKPKPAPKPGYQETKPPTSKLGGTFSTDEIRYCVAENIRIKAAQEVVNPYSDAEVNRYNRYVNDYNARCSSFRYYGSQLAVAQAEAETIRAKLERQGRNRIKRKSKQ